MSEYTQNPDGVSRRDFLVATGAGTALVELRDGRVNAALGRLVQNGNVTVFDNADLVRDAMVADWMASIGVIPYLTINANCRAATP